MQRIRQAEAVTSSAKNRKSKPVIIAPIILAAAMSITKRITDTKSVPKIPVSSSDKKLHMHLSARAPDKTVSVKSTPRLTTPIANSAQRKGVLTVSIPEAVKKPAMMPITILTSTPMPIQLGLQLQLFIKSSPVKEYATPWRFVNKK